MIKSVGPLGAFLLTGTLASAQTPLEIGRSYRIQSEVLNETRVIDVTLPADYDAETTRRYPVLVVLDSDQEHEIAAATARFYASVGRLPPLIVVGVRNTDRMHDMTPAPAAGFRVPPAVEHAGGADKFLGFIADELVPYLDRTYRTTPMRVLVGHSLGGLFALHALAERPDAFMGYVVMEPAAWWNDQREFRAARDGLARPAARRARVMLVNTERWNVDTTAWGGTVPMVRHFEVRGETHASMALVGMAQALRMMFADFGPATWRPGMKPVAMLERYDSLAARVGYAVPIPEGAYAVVARMSIDARYYDDAGRVLDRMEQRLGASEESKRLRDKLAHDRADPRPGFIQLEIPARRPSPRDAAAFLGRWTSENHEVEIRAAGDTIIVRDIIQFPDGGRYEDNDPVIQVTADGALEWGLPWFRGLAALVVLKARVQGDGTMAVTREPRGWVPEQGGPDITGTQRFRRVAQSP